MIFSGTRLPSQLEDWLLQVRSAGCWEVLRLQQHGPHQYRQPRQGGSLPRPGGQGQAEVLLDRGQGKQRQHQVAQRQAIQQRQLVQHWRVSQKQIKIPLKSHQINPCPILELEDLSLITERVMSFVWLCSITFTLMESDSTMCPVTIRSRQSVKPEDKG